MENLLKNKKVVITGILILVIIGIVLWLRRRKKQESGYVTPRGYFPSAPPPPPMPPPPGPPPPPPPPGPPGPPPPPGPPGPPPGPPPPPPPCSTPPCPPPPPPPPYPPYPFYGGYGYGPYYDPFPRTYIVEDNTSAERPSTMSTKEYIKYLQHRINALEVAYDNAISDLMFGRAFRIKRQIRALKAQLESYYG